ncbi:unnamed protein product [Penicillium egyptiacum]|uniref:Transcription factor domain-containing protein n=1 Tax=Penicillium egyptiacum TaxID=1303716 RepID=A0A9W4P3I1_9EURO|nr:unnamed protein product [Penicillium egyptiacum]
MRIEISIFAFLLTIWDACSSRSLLSRQLDRIAILPYHLGSERLPRIDLGPELEDNKDLDEYTEHLLQARLANFWRTSPANCNSEYDIVAAEERYERFCNEYLTTIPPAFALPPNAQWDEHLSMLQKQRETLHIAIFQSLCYNFRPALLQTPRQTLHLPKYKQILLLSQRKALAVAALRVLKCTSSLHALMGGSQTRFPGIIQPTFEASVLLVYLCMDQALFEGDEIRCPSLLTIDPLGASMRNLKRVECTNALRDALRRLQRLAEVSHMAEVGAEGLLQLLQKAIKPSWTGQAGQAGERSSSLANNDLLQADNASGDTGLAEYLDLNPNLLPGMTTITGSGYSDLSWESMVSGLRNFPPGESMNL